MKNQNTNKSQIILGIILFVIIIICSIYVENLNNSNYDENTNNLYSNLNIDKSKLNIFYLNVGQADSTLITMGEDVMLIDAGNEKDGKYIVQFLKAQGIDEINYLIETHSDDDHSGGIETIVNNLSVSNVYMPQSGIAKSEIKETDINVNGENREARLIGNRKYSLFFILIYCRFHQQLCKHHLLIVKNFYKKLLLE